MTVTDPVALGKLFTSSNPNDKDVVFGWTPEQATLYVQGLRSRAETVQPATLSTILKNAYDQLIQPCLVLKTPTNPAMSAKSPPYQWDVIDLKKDNKFEVKLKTVIVSDNVGPKVELTDFYSCLGWLIGMIERDIHPLANDEHHPYCRELLLRFAKLCYMMHMKFFKAHVTPKPPKQAFILYGSTAGKQSASGFAGAHAASLSASVPHSNIVAEYAGGLIINPDLAMQAQKLRADVVYKTIGQGPKAQIDKLVAELCGPSNDVWPAGNCAEWIPFASRLSELAGKDVTLYGLCVSIKTVGTCTTLAQASGKPGCETATCKTCKQIVCFVGGQHYLDKAA